MPTLKTVVVDLWLAKASCDGEREASFYIAAGTRRLARSKATAHAARIFSVHDGPRIPPSRVEIDDLTRMGKVVH